jgi:serine/threonine protein kinase
MTSELTERLQASPEALSNRTRARRRRHVYRLVAEEAALGRKVAIKVLRQDLSAEISNERFKREILFAARLQHPHIVPVLTAGEIDGLPFYTMPFVPGESLVARLAREGALPVPEAVACSAESRGLWPTRTAAESSIATSSPGTCWWSMERLWSPISESPRRSCAREVRPRAKQNCQPMPTGPRSRSSVS